ncbi:MAG: DUF5107 domain-containing protein [Clostridia bacterium]|nr:DUF5107 domain-containing protein [Clostridia bacterium]
MTKLTFEDYEILSADLGEENMLPDIKNVDYLKRAKYALSEKIPPEDGKYFNQGHIKTILPYTVQDNYNRDRKIRKFHAAILENDKLKAVFLPELGGRLWSLYHKGLKKELLYVNSVFQPANLAIRNAWFSGGIEWNVGMRGHTPLTCSQMYACRMEDEKGNPCLRMYEFERIRGLAYSIDFMLPENSEILYVKTTVENTNDDARYMYWWSNIAVPEEEGVRILAPCDSSYVTLYNDEKGHYLDLEPMPFSDRSGETLDISYPENSFRSLDFFYKTRNNHRKWEATFGKDGTGLGQFSTPELIGRKLFVWGQGKGGRNWCKWLSDKYEPYIEIQAGLLSTQLEHIPMPAKTTWSWVEGYFAAVCDPETVHGEYQSAVSAFEDYLESFAPSDDEMRALFDNVKPVSMEQMGSAWGYVENCLREKAGKAGVSPRLEFPAEAITDGEKLWLDFLTTGYMSDYDLTEPPKSFHVDPLWLPMFEKQIADGKANAYMYLQYGVALYANDMVTEAYQAFEKSIELTPNAWAYRNLSMIENNVYENKEKGLYYIEKAMALNATYRGLVVNCGQVMLGVEAYEKWLAIYDNLTDALKADGRLMIYRVIALMEVGRYEEASAVLHNSFEIYDVREGEVSITKVWEDLHRRMIVKETGITDADELNRLYKERYPLPQELNFSQKEDQ